MKKVFIILFSLMSSLSALSQLKNGEIVNQIRIKISDTVPVFWDSTARILSPYEFDLTKDLVNEYAISEVENSMYFAQNQRLKRYLIVKFREFDKRKDLIAILERDNRIEFIEGISYNTTHIIPDDISYTQQWHLPHINAEEAWDISNGVSSIDVAIVDDAIEISHPDLSGNIQGGWDIADDDPDPSPPNSNYYHGTHVAGIAAARTNNSTGIASIGWNIDIIPVKASNGTPNPDNPNSVLITNGWEGITWAAQNGAEIINCSWGHWSGNGSGYYQFEQDVINNAWNNFNCIIVASAGNNDSGLPSYPAAYDHVIAVANSTSNDTKNSSSNFGDWVDVTAPGTSIYSTKINNNYGNLTGTSMSAPLVSGLLGLIWSVNTAASRNSVINCLIQNTVPLNWSGGGSGRIDAFAAVSCVNSGGNNNDNCGQATLLSSSATCNYTTGSVEGATPSGLAIPTCSGFTSSTAFDVWYKFVAQSSEHTILVDPTGILGSNSSVDPVVAIYSYCSDNGFIQCEDDAGGGGGNCEMTVSNLNVGSVYYIRVYDYGSVPPVNAGFNICVTHPDNDDGSHDFYTQNLFLNSASYDVGDPLEISVDQYTNNPDGPAVSPTLQYTIRTANGVLIQELGTDGSVIGDGDEYDGESLNISFPSGVPGSSCQICAEANYDLAIPESNTDNNRSCIEVSLQGGDTYHDFYTQNLSLNSLTFSAGDPLEISVEQYTDNPDGPSVSPTLQYTIRMANGVLIQELGTDGSVIGDGDEYDGESLNISFPSGVPGSTCQICAEANYDLAVPENTTGNNRSCIEVLLPGNNSDHDFYIQNLSLNSMTYSAGDPLEILVSQYTNNPDGPAVSPVLQYTIRTDNGTLIQELGTDNSSIGGGDEYDEESLNASFPPDFLPSSCQICAESNYDQSIPENITDNNILCMPIIVPTEDVIFLNERCKIYPNPVRDQITIETENNANYKVNIINILGQIMFSCHLINKVSVFSTMDLPKGVYEIILYDERGNGLSKKIIKS